MILILINRLRFVIDPNPEGKIIIVIRNRIQQRHFPANPAVGGAEQPGSRPLHHRGRRHATHALIQEEWQEQDG